MPKKTEALSESSSDEEVEVVVAETTEKLPELPPSRGGRKYKRVPPEADKRKKENAPVRTEAQKAAWARAMAVMKEKREAHRATQEKEAAENKETLHQVKLKERYAKIEAKKKALPPVAQYVTVKDLYDFKKEFFDMMPHIVREPPPPPKEIYKEVPVDAPRLVPYPVVKEVVRVVEKPARVITGNELLDRLYFGGK
jgi:hypothetical protein